jgi:hypothetical protein
MNLSQASRPERRPGPVEPTGQVGVDQVLTNLSDEISVALAICVNIEEIVSDRMLHAGRQSSFIRTELQNLDRLIQMLTDFRTLTGILARTTQGQTVATQSLRENLCMEETARRLLSDQPTRRSGDQVSTSDVTFF